MHTFSETGAGVPAFLAKLWRLVEDAETNNLIYWSKDGRSFIIQNQAQFARELLPLNYKHNNMASFIRQLNMYGFHKITSIDNGGLKFDRDEMEFTHPCFKRGCPYLLEHIKRKIANTKQHQQLIDDKAGVKIESVSKVLNEVKVVRGRQESLDSRFNIMKQENEALWREIASLRQKHIKQQQIVNKLIQFLVTIVQPSRNMSGVKRTFQLMINDAPQSTKTRKASESESGPVIHELSEELLDEVVDVDEGDEDILSGPPSPHVTISSGTEQTQAESLSPVSNVERPNSTLSVSSQVYEQQSNQSLDDAKFLNSSNTNSNGSNSDNQWVYHIREIPENFDMNNEPIPFVEENILNTPMVKREMAKKDQSLFNETNTIKQMEQRSSRKRKLEKESPGIEHVKNLKNMSDDLKIKTEKSELDPLMFLETSSANSCSLSPAIDPALISPNNVSTSNVAGSGNKSTSNMEYLNQGEKHNTSESSSRGKAMYEGDFLNTDMPSDLFEDSPMACDINLASSSLERQTPTPSTSKAETINESTSTSNNNGNDNINNNDTSSSRKGQKNMTVVKYSSQKSSDDIMKLHTPEDFHNHLDGVQDDLENLKDLLKEGYSFDTGTLTGNGDSSSNRIYLSQPVETDIWTKLFNDSDILAPYGFLNNEQPDNNGNKGSELTTYQPYGYNDLSDILDINDKESDIDEVNTASAENSDGFNSELNTPRPEPRKAPF